MKVYGLKSCDTCRKAMRQIREAGLEPGFVDVRADGVPAEEMARFLAVLGDDLVNRKSATWRGLSAAERARRPADLLADHPTLMKRPLIELEDGTLTLGWSDDVCRRVLEGAQKG